MGKSRRKFSREFKLEAVKQVLEQGRTIAAVAECIDVNPNLLSRWKTQFETEAALAFPGHGRRAETEAEAVIRRLKRELSIARQERNLEVTSFAGPSRFAR